MSIELPVVIKVDAPGAIPTIAGTEAALAKVEAAGPRAGAAISAGLRESSAAAVKASASADDLRDRMMSLANVGNAFAGLTAQLQLEAKVLDQINGPAKQYAETLSALDGLLMKNSISTEQYADQVTRLNQRLGETPAAPEQKSEGFSIGGATEAFAGAAAGLGIIELGKGIGELIEDSARLSDQYVALSNSAQLFVDSTHTVNDVLGEQSELADQLHSTIGPTIDLYRRVKEGADQMNLSSGQTRDLTRSLGEAVQLSGKSMEQAGEVMNRLAYSMANGTVDARTMTQTMREVPALADLWTKSLGVTRDQLTKMVTGGQIGMKQLADITIGGVGQMDASFQKLGRTEAQEKAAALERMNVARQQYSDMRDAGMSAIEIQQKAMSGHFVNPMTGEMGEAGQAIEYWKEFNEQLTKGTGQFQAMGDAKRLAMEAAGSALATQISDITAKVELSATAFAKLIKPSVDHAAAVRDATVDLMAQKAAFDAGGISAEMYKSKMREDQDQIAGGATELVKHTRALVDASDAAKRLAADHAAGAYSAEEYRDKMRQLTDTINGGADAYTKMLRGVADSNELGKVIADLDQPLLNANAHVEVLTEAYDRGALSFDRYRNEVTKTMEALAKANELPVNSATGGLGSVSKADLGGDAAQFKFTGPANAAQGEQQKKNDEAAAEMYKAIATPAEKYQDDLDKINKLHEANALSGDKYTRTVDALKDRYTTIKTPAEEYAASVKKLDQEMATHLVSLEAYDDAMRKLRLDSGNGSFADGMTQGLKDFVKEARGSANEVSSAFKKGLDGVNDQIVSLVTTGKTDFSSLAKSVESDFLKASLHSAESGIAGLFSSGAGGASAGATTTAAMATGGATAGATISLAMTTAGATVAAAIAAAMTTGGAAAGAESGLSADALSGAAVGGDFGYGDIPGAASGFSGIATGSGGTDSKLAMFRITPGEHVSIRTPEQVGLSRSSSQPASRQAPPQIHVHLQDDKRALPQAMDTREGQRVTARVNRKLGR